MENKTAIGLFFLIIIILLLAWMLLPGGVPGEIEAVTEDFRIALWQYRSLDVLVQITIVFTGVMAVLSLLREDET